MLADHVLKTKIEYKIHRNKRFKIYLSKSTTWSIKELFQHYMTNGEFKDLPRRLVSDKVLRDEVFNIAKNRKDVRYQRGFDLVVSKFCFIKSILVMLLHVQINLLIKVKLYQTNNWLKNCTNQLLENVKNVKYYISGADLADTLLISKY